MKKLLLAALFVAAASVTFAAPCASSSDAYTDYNLSTSCSIGAVTFSNFNWISSGSGGVVTGNGSGGLLSGISLTPITTAGSEGFQLNFANLNATANQSADVTLSYIVTSPTPVGGYNLGGVGATATGTGTVIISDSFYSNPGTPLGSVPIGGATVGNSIGYVATSSSAAYTNDPSMFFSPQTSFIVVKDINASSNGAGVAHVSALIEQNAVPEPMTMSLLGVGLLGLGLFGRRLKK